MVTTFILFIFLSIIIGLYASRGILNNAESYFLANRSLGGWILGISAGATANTGFIVIGAVGMGYSLGTGSYIYPISWMLGDILFWFVFAERINVIGKQGNHITISNLISSDTGAKLVKTASAIIIIALLMVYTSAQFSAAGKTLNAFFDVSPNISIILTSIIILVYILWGGFKASVMTDMLQGISMIILTVGIILWGIVDMGGITEFLKTLKSIGIDFFGGRSFFTSFLFMLGFAFAGYGFSMSQPQVTTRVLAGSDEKAIKTAKWVYIIFLQITWAGMCTIGIIAKHYLPDLLDPEQALPLFAREVFSPVVIGLVLAGMFATIMSSADSLIISSGSIFSLDLQGSTKAQQEVPNLKMFRLSIIGVTVISIILSVFSSATVFQASLFAATILGASIGSLVFIVVLNLPHSKNSLLVAMIIGLTVGMTWNLLGFGNFISDALVGFAFAVGCNSLVMKFENIFAP